MVRLERKLRCTTSAKCSTALLSVADKTGLIDLAQALQSLGIVILSTGGTAQHLRDHGIAVTDVSDQTQFPEILDGRVKTLHPAIHAGILSRRTEEDVNTLNTHALSHIDLVIVNLYPFFDKPSIDTIDIGGPTMLRAAAKNHAHVTAVIDPADYPLIIDALKTTQTTSSAIRKKLAKKVFAYCAKYNAAIADFLTDEEETALPTTLPADYTATQSLRYGENPHQAASLYQRNPMTGSLAATQPIQGKPLSFNNLMDTNAALSCVRALDHNQPACVIVKHATPCGVGQAASPHEAYTKALACDSQSAFGGIIAFNTTLDASTAQSIIDQQFAEVIIAPVIADEAKALLATKSSWRVLETGLLTTTLTAPTYHSIDGGLLLQSADAATLTPADITVATKRQPTSQELADCLFAWHVVKYVKSNAIVYAKDQATLGIGTGQTSRVFSAKIAALKATEAGLSLQGAAMASDAFFPFADGIQIAIDAGITAIIQPGGSIRDKDVIAAADKAGITMLFTGIRHFRH